MKIKKVTQNDPVERLAVSVRQSVMKTLEAYRDFYKQTYGEEIERSQLVEQILREFMASDKDFQKHVLNAAPQANGQVGSPEAPFVPS